jgi:hypothetical protein
MPIGTWLAANAGRVVAGSVTHDAERPSRSGGDGHSEDGKTNRHDEPRHGVVAIPGFT